MRASFVWFVVAWGVLFFASPSLAEAGSSASRPAYLVPVQIPYNAPPEAEFPEVQQATPAPEVLSEKELQRAEALLPLLEGRQELYIIAEFVHLGKPVVPVLVKALKMPGSRLRYNAIETLEIIKDPRAVPDLLDVARDGEEITRVRAHALRVAVRLAPMEALPMLQTLVKDQADSIRQAVAFESRHVRRPESVSLLIELLGDQEKYVSITARDSLWLLTRRAAPPHDWQGSTHEQRLAWSEEWKVWWDKTLKEREAAPNKPESEPVS
ncbi:MAG: HEAT repeat domain-containing protein [Nitrospira sp.]|nr:HEAT repeat domain-containing protein [Nitrospira sp.]